MENNIDRDALKEVYIILNELDLYNRIPVELQEYIDENKSDEHTFSFDKDKPLFNQVKNTKTSLLLTYLYTQYIGDNKNTMVILKDIVDILNNNK